VRLHLEDARVLIRPSGTEPKLKAYAEVVVSADGRRLEDAKAEADAGLAALLTAINTLLHT
jgi:phosphomannomutase